MATFGHLAAGYALARTGAAHESRLVTAVIVGASVLPDVDLLLGLEHRGPTHSLGFAATVAAFSGFLFALAGVRRPLLAGMLAGLAVCTHVGLDLLTAHSPVRLLWPVSSWEFGLSQLILPAAPTDDSVLTGRGARLVAGELAWSAALVLLALAFRRRNPGHGPR